MPEPTVLDIFSAQRPYLIGPFDKLQISVFGIQDLSMKIQTDASGRISFPLAGEVEAAGKTPMQLARLIEDRLRARYVRDPQVTVNLEETVSQQFTVEGEVREPGLYPLVGQMTLLRAIATAKGTGEFARLKDVVIFRTVSGQRYAGLYNLDAIRRGNYTDPDIFPGDVVVVGDSKSRRIFKDVLAATPALLTPIIVLLR
ncbi:MAG: transposase [Sphingobium sp.]|nr:transposase [Sphingobium sp.]